MSFWGEKNLAIQVHNLGVSLKWWYPRKHHPKIIIIVGKNQRLLGITILGTPHMGEQKPLGTQLLRVLEAHP